MQIGRHTYVDGDKIDLVWVQAELTIGAFTSIARGLTVFLGGDHRADWISTFPFTTMWPPVPGEGHPATKGDVSIGNDVWIGDGVTILSGVTIGDGAVIGARSVVTKDVGPYEVWAGNPARCKRQRFSQKEIDFLLKLRWWDWEDDRVRGAIPILMSGDIEALRKAVGQ